MLIILHTRKFSRNKRRINRKEQIEFKTYLWINFRTLPPGGVYSLRIVVIKDHLTGEETGAMENNEIFVEKRGRGVIEEKGGQRFVLEYEYEILSNCVENEKNRGEGKPV